MMKTNQILTMAATLLVAAALTACSNNDVTQDDDTSKNTQPEHFINITVSKGGFDTPASRAVPTMGEGDEYGLTTLFTTGDALGIYATDAEGHIIEGQENVKYVFDGMQWSSLTPIEYDKAHHYYAYFPYQEEPAGTPSDVAEGANAETFFTEIIANWDVKADQSDITNYAASDLMTSKGDTPEDNATIHFELAHQMSLVLISINDYTWTANGDYTWTEPATRSLRGDHRPLLWDNYFRLIVKPDGEQFNVLSSDGSWFKTISAGEEERDKCRVFKIGGVQPYSLTVGDIAYKDGSFSHELNARKVPIGILGYVGNDDVTDDVDAEGKRTYTHGLVISTRLSKGFNPNKDKRQPVITNNPDVFHAIQNFGYAVQDYGGLRKSEIIKGNIWDEDRDAWTRERQPNASEWFIPSAGQMANIVAQLTDTDISSWYTTNANHSLYWLNDNDDKDIGDENCVFDHIRTKFNTKLGVVGNGYFDEFKRNNLYVSSYAEDNCNLELILTDEHFGFTCRSKGIEYCYPVYAF